MPAGAALDALLANSRELMVLSDAQGCIRWVNPAFAGLSGWKACVGELLIPALQPDPDDKLSAEAFRQRLLDALQQGQLGDAVARLHRPQLSPDDDDADPLWLRLRICSAGEDRLWNLSDLRAERRAEAQTRRLAEMLDLAQEFGHMGVWERDLRTGQGHWDRHVFRFWGLDPAEGTPSFDAAEARVHPDDRLASPLTDPRQRPGRYAKRYRLMRADGEFRSIHSQWEIKADRDGQAARAIGVMMDETEALSMAHSLDDATAQLKLAVDLAQIAIWRHDLRSNRMYYNPRGFEVIDQAYRPEGLSIDEVRALIHPDDLPAVLATAQQGLKASGPIDMEARYLRSDGTWRHVLTRRVLQRDALGAPVAFVGVALDMTDRVDQQRQAEALARHLDLATSAAGIGVWSRDALTGQGHWNAEMYRIFGRSPQRGAPGREEWLNELVHPEDREPNDAAYVKMMAEGDGVMEHEFRVRRSDGALRWLATRARREIWGGRTMAFGATLDITERRLAAQALQKANERILLATRGAGIGTWEEDLLTGEVTWDAQMYALRQLPPPDPSNNTPSARSLRMKLVHPEELPQLVAAVQRSIAERSMASNDYRVRWPDGSYHWLASRSVAIYDDEGRAQRVIGVNWDIDERVQSEALRREALAVQRQSEAKSQFLARMSHELRTPLNAILGFTQLLEIDGQEASEAERPQAGQDPQARDVRATRLRHIRQAAEQLLALVNEVLDLSSLEAGQLRINAGPIPLDPLLAEVTTEHEALARSRSILLQLQASGLTVVADRDRLRQVLNKLVDHRLQSLPAGSQLAMAARSDSGGLEVQIILADTGRRLSTAQQMHLFEPFYRLGQGHEDGDTGVRLALVKALLASMGGRIDATSRKEGDNQFVLSLPGQAAGHLPNAAQQDLPLQMPHLAPAPAAGAPSPSGRVLYIEDNPINVILVQELIAQRGGLELVCEGTGEVWRVACHRDAAGAGADRHAVARFRWFRGAAPTACTSPDDSNPLRGPVGQCHAGRHHTRHGGRLRRLLDETHPLQQFSGRAGRGVSATDQRPGLRRDRAHRSASADEAQRPSSFSSAISSFSSNFLFSQFCDHRVFHVHGLVQGVVIHGHGGVGGHDPAARVAGGDDFGLELGQAQHQIVRILVQKGGLIDLGGLQLEGDAHGLQPVAPAGAAAGQDEGLEGDFGEAGLGVGHRRPPSRRWQRRSS